jgi:hypothetical protein
MLLIASLLSITFLLPFQSSGALWVLVEMAIRSLFIGLVYAVLVYRLHLSADLQVYLHKALLLAQKWRP